MLALSMMVFVKDYDMESAMATLTVLFYPGGPIPVSYTHLSVGWAAR